MKRALRSVAPALLAGAAAACTVAPDPFAGGEGAAAVAVELDQAVPGLPIVAVSITNESRAAVDIRRSQLPLWGDSRQLFAVAHGGIAVAATAVADGAPVRADERVTLSPGENIRVAVDLAPYFDLAGAGVPADATVEVAYLGEPLAAGADAVLEVAGSIDIELRAGASPPRPESVQAAGGYLSLRMSGSEYDKSAHDSGYKLYVHGVKTPSFAPQALDVIVGNYSGGGNARTYDTFTDIWLQCPGVGPSFPPHSIYASLSVALDAGESRAVTDIGCNVLVPPGEGFEVTIGLSFEQWECNPLFCN